MATDIPRSTDYIIVGGGTDVLMVAARLFENPDINIGGPPGPPGPPGASGGYSGGPSQDTSWKAADVGLFNPDAKDPTGEGIVTIFDLSVCTKPSLV